MNGAIVGCDSLAPSSDGFVEAAVTDTLLRLGAALGDRYRIEREAGRGGMATVFVAEDLKHHRSVAIKVLEPELAASVGRERFLREIQLAARLTHPNILPLHDSGAAGDLFYYVMPYIVGESLRRRLEREKQLPVDEAVRIAREVADALAYAHRAGVVHRDIKPENILLSTSHALVADFGIAKAIGATDATGVTSTGITLGTPLYMSPEQASGVAVDGRSDLYALGCVLYEMLAGQPPFTGPSSESLAHQHLSVAPRPVTDIRPSVPAHIARALERVLAKAAADRFTSAESFAEALASAPTVVPPSPGKRLASPVVVLSAVGLLLLAAAALLWFRHPPGPRSVNPAVVAVFPFRTTGAGEDPEYLHEGMVDLLAAKFTGDGGPRAVEPATLLSRWRRKMRSARGDLSGAEALGLARELGAGQAILGSVVGTHGNLVIHASLLGASRSGSGQDAETEGPPDSLAVLVDRLAAQLLARSAGETEENLPDLTTRSLPALRAYLAGQAAFRRGAYKEAISHHVRALEVDPTFALAALGVVSAADWTGGEDGVAYDRAARSAWAWRERLNTRERALLEAYVGPHFPGPASRSEFLAAWESAARVAPDRAVAWFNVGDVFFHYGGAIGRADWHERAHAGFARALALDSSFSAPIEHLLELAILERDSSAVSNLAALYFSVDSAGDLSNYVRWRVAVAQGDTPARAQLRSRFERFGTQSLKRIIGTAQLDGVALEDAERAAVILTRRAGTREEQWDAVNRAWTLYVNEGRPRAALAVLKTLLPADRFGGMAAVGRYQLRPVLLWDADSVGSSAAVRQLARLADAPLAATAAERAGQYEGAIQLAVWRISHADLLAARSNIEKLHRSAYPTDSLWTVGDNQVWASVLEAMLATAERRSRAMTLVRRADSVLATSPLQSRVNSLNLIVVRLLEAQGDLSGALAAIRRNTYHWNYQSYLSSCLREEGRLAALTGDRPGAIRAYRHYLALRSNPEPALAAEVKRVRVAVEDLERQGR